MYWSKYKCHAKWIWDAYHRYTANCYIFFRKRFSLQEIENIEEICVFCATPGEYKLYLNEEYIGRGSVPNQVSLLYYDHYIIKKKEIPAFVNKENILTVLAYNYGTGVQYRPFSPAGFLFQMEVKYRCGKVEYIVSDSSWKTAIPDCFDQHAPKMFWTLGFQEIVDLNKFNPEIKSLRYNDNVWTEYEDTKNNIDPTEFSGESWDFAVEIEQYSWNRLIPRDIPFLKEVVCYPVSIADYGKCKLDFNISNPINIADLIIAEQHSPLGICNMKCSTTEDVEMHGECDGSTFYVVFDFGKEIVGYPAFEIISEEKLLIDIGYSECLDGYGRVNPTRQGIKQADRIITRSGNSAWEIFNRRAFRYLQLTIRGLRKKCVLKKVYINALRYPFEKEGSFQCSNETINKIFEVSKYTLDICMKEHYEDCPLREHAQYIGDVRVESLMNYYAFGDTKLISKALRQFALDQNDSGWFRALCPGSTNHNIVDYLPFWIISLWDYYMYTGDTGLLREVYSNMNKLMEWLKAESDENGLLAKKAGWWIFIDWADIKKQGIVTGLQCVYYKSLVYSGKIARLLGHVETGRKYLREALNVRNLINSLLWDDKAEAYVDCLVPGMNCRKGFSRQTNCFAVLFGIADAKRREGVKKFLLEHKEPEINTGYFKLYELDALYSLGIHEDFFKGFSYWAGMLEAGATTWWEIFNRKDKIIPDVSLCHGWSSAPLYLLPSKVLGIIPVKPGFEEFIIKPDLLDMKWAECHVPTIKGDIFVKVLSDDVYRIRITCKIPEKTVAHLILKNEKGAEIKTVSINGKDKHVQSIDREYIYYRLEGL